MIGKKYNLWPLPEGQKPKPDEPAKHVQSTDQATATKACRPLPPTTLNAHFWKAVTPQKGEARQPWRERTAAGGSLGTLGLCPPATNQSGQLGKSGLSLRGFSEPVQAAFCIHRHGLFKNLKTDC